MKLQDRSSQSNLRNPNDGNVPQPYFEDCESACSTPYVSAPSSPGRSSGSSSTTAVVSGGFFYSAPASPIHFSLNSNKGNHGGSSKDANSVSMGYEFEFSARFGTAGPVQTGSMSSADELFLNGKIRPMKLSTHLERPQALAPLVDLDAEDEQEEGDGETIGRDLRVRDKSARRRTRSLSPMRSPGPDFEWIESENNGNNHENAANDEGGNNDENDEGNASLKLTPNASSSSSSSRSSSAGRNSKRWLFLKEFLRSKSEGRSNNKYFWSKNIISFSPAAAKEKKPPIGGETSAVSGSEDAAEKNGGGTANEAKKNGGKNMAAAGRTRPANGVVEKNKSKKKKTYELHYAANRAQAEELKRKTYLPYRQGLLGCLGFSSKGYGAVNGLARALNPVSSR